MERFDSLTSDHIVLSKRQVSMIMASMLLFCLFVFIAGFFLGKRIFIEKYSEKVSRDVLYDQVDFLVTKESLHAPFKKSFDTFADTLENSFIDSNADEKNSIKETEEVTDLNITTPALLEEPVKITVSANLENDITLKSENKCYAQLIGFGTKKAAQAFVLRLKKYDIPVILKTIVSKTSKGKQKIWYQAVTPIYESEKALIEQIAKIKRLEHIRDIDMKIVHTK